MTNLDANGRTTLGIEDAERITFYYERWRAVAAGVMETAGATFILLIAVKYFEAGSTQKALLASGFNPGLLLTPLVVYVVSRAGWRATRAAAVLAALGAGGFLLAATVRSLPVFLVGCMIGLLAATSFVPLMTQMYQDNYRPDRRGRLFSNAVIIRIITAAVVSFAAGKMLSYDLSLYQVLMLVFAVALLATSYCVARCPSQPLARDKHTGLFSGLRYVKEDALFRQMLISWMLMGFANLVMYQLRVEYMANPQWAGPGEEAFSPETIALVTGVIPNVARLFVSPIWGRLFDRMNFFTLRITLNAGLAAGALAFFAGRDMKGMVLGGIIFGIANAGGEVAWSLWVTKLAAPERVAEYMSVHTFLTGVRGVAAPVVGYYMLTRVQFSTLSLMCAGLIGVASLILVPGIWAARAAKAGAPLTEEIAD